MVAKSHSPVCSEYDNSEKLVIFIHGFMGSPDQFADLATAVYDKGFSFSSILLPGHGADIKTFAKYTTQDWESLLQNEIGKYINKYTKIYLVGHSMGGLLALNASIDTQNKIAGVFMISTPVKINIFNLKSSALKLRLLFYPKKHIVKSVYLQSNSISKINIFSCVYFIKPVTEFFKLIRKTTNNLKNVFVPVYMIYSKNDETTSYKSMKILCDGLLNKEALTINKSRHAYFEDSERKIICEKLLEFICK